MDTTKAAQLPLIKVVGVSGSGKSTLVRLLRQAGYLARTVSQEHSSVPDLWQQFDQPQILIFLYVDVEQQRLRRPDVAWNRAGLAAEEKRLADARAHANLRINTSGLSGELVFKITLSYLKHAKIGHSSDPLPPTPATGTSGKPRPTE